MSTFNVLLVHGGEQGLDAYKAEILEVLPELEDRRNVKSTDRSYLMERIFDEGKAFDAIIFTKEADITEGVLTKLLHMKDYRPREIVVIGKRKGVTTAKETIFVVEQLSKDWKTNLYSLDAT